MGYSPWGHEESDMTERLHNFTILPRGGYGHPLQYPWASLVAQLVTNLPAMWETWVQSLGWQDPLEKRTAAHSSILAWRIRGLHSPWGCRESAVTERLSLFVPSEGVLAIVVDTMVI